MADFFEIDFLDVEARKSGDAICLRYEVAGQQTIHVVDGGYQDTGDKVLEHLRKYYGDPSFIDRVIVTHNDGDHTGGLRKVLAEKEVGELWMLRPWLYAEHLIDRFPTYSSVTHLRSRLRSAYGNLAALEDIADTRGIPIREPFQGAQIGAFRVLAPTPQRYLDLIVESEKTPVAKDESLGGLLGSFIESAKAVATSFVKSLWGDEYFPPGDTSSENEMSVVQFARICGKRILLTGDTGRGGLREVIDYAPLVGLDLPGLDYFQVPHHGGRHNVTTELLDEILGARLAVQPPLGEGHFETVISSAKADPDHPRKSVKRAMMHRGGNVATTEGRSVRVNSSNAPARNWTPVVREPYPDDQEA
jgi:hypothetical protein